MIFNKILKFSLTIIVLVFAILSYPLSKIVKDNFDKEEVKNNGQK